MAETRERIARAAYELHASVGPARTTISAIAARAGVQRHTVYQHFPDDMTLFAACTSYGLSLDRPPEPDTLSHLADPQLRTKTALEQQYAYYRRNEALLANLDRDTPLMQERLQHAGLEWSALPEVLRAFSTQPARLNAGLAGGWNVPDARRHQFLAALGLALDFGTWRTLTGNQGLDDDQAVALMMEFVRCVAQSSTSR
jgi:AcrR family transcriptional regulator